MKKLFTLAAAVLASFSLWAVDPTFESYDWDQTEVASVVGTHGDITILSEGLGSVGNVSGHYYIPLNQNLKNSDSSWKFFGISATSKIDSIEVLYCTNGSTTSVTNIAWVAWGTGVTPNQETLGHGLTTGLVSKGKTWADAAWEKIDLSAIDASTIYLSRSVREFREIGGTSNLANFGGGQTINILGIRVWLAPTCLDPESSIRQDTACFVNDVVNINYDSKSGAGCQFFVKKNGADAVYDVDYTKGAGISTITPLVAGEFVVTIKQPEYNGYCAIEESFTMTVAEKVPVTEVIVTGPTTGVIGQTLVFKATPDAPPSEISWYLNDVWQGTSLVDTFAFTPTTKGTYSIVAQSKNQFNAVGTWINSASHDVTITKVCGELIKAVYNANTKTSTVTGVVGGTADRNTQDNGKLGSNGHYYGVALTSGSFMFGDTVTVVASTLNGGNTATIYADKTGTTLLGSVPFDTISKMAKLVLSQGASVVYLYRKDSGCNPNIESLSVSRACEESDNYNAKVFINGEEVTPSGTVFNYTLSASYTDPTVAVEIVLEHPLATLMEDHAASFTMATPEVGTPSVETFKVKAENGEQGWYSIFVNKSASLSDDATLKALSVTGLTLDPVFDANVTEYTVTKAYEAAMPTEANVTAEANSSNAKSVVVAITDNVITVTVTAENDDTKVYTITVNNAPAVKKINEIILSNGYSAYIPEGQTVQPFSTFGFYLAGQDAPTVSSYQVNEGTTWAIDGNNITLTGADNSTATYYLTLETVTPADFSADEITFDGTEAWVKAANGFGADKGGWKFSKTDNDFSREIAGKTHVEFFLPACDTVVLKAGAQGTERDVRFYVNGTQFGDKAKLTKAGVALAVEQSAPFMLTVASAQTSGDGGIGAIRMARKPEDPTGINNTEDGVKAVKVIRDGQLFIIKGDKIFNIIGAEIR